ncbi:hypothetical protein JXQ31_20755 [candidate division KSB1 bacterium]|nr:hypothetical protein [candidate division KSB1 bacterium]
MESIKVFKLLRFTYVTIILSIFVLLINCSKKQPEISDEIIFVKVGDKSISVNEFYKRAEYTIRPAYCKMDNYIHKKIILNSLIAEKLLALEAGDDNELIKSEAFQNFIKGRREQEMRKYLYRKEGLEKVNLDSSLINQAYRYAGRKYKIAYFSVEGNLSADLIRKRMDSGVSFEGIYQEIIGSEKIPEREVEWSKEENDIIYNALFMDNKTIGQVIGPLEAQEGLITTIKILGWKDYPAIGETKINQRLNDVKERLTSEKALEVYSEFAGRIMAGKKVEFMENTFFKVAELVEPFYMPTQEEKENSFNQRFWNKKEKSDLNIDELGFDFEDIKDEPFLKLNNEIWTVEDIRNELAVHPLVFRERKFNRREFPKQFKLAIVDMIRDKYLAEEAYKRGYDKVEPVVRNIEMWTDNAKSLYQMQEYLRNAGCEYNYAKDYMKIINEYLNPYVDSLQTKYSDVIEINTDIFEKLKLTSIDMFAVEKNVPYPIIVPGFPVITDDTRLNYGKKME